MNLSENGYKEGQLEVKLSHAALAFPIPFHIMHEQHIHNLNVVNVIKTLKAINCCVRAAENFDIGMNSGAIKKSTKTQHSHLHTAGASERRWRRRQQRQKMERNTKLKFITQ